MSLPTPPPPDNGAGTRTIAIPVPLLHKVWNTVHVAQRRNFRFERGDALAGGGHSAEAPFHKLARRY